MRWRDALFCAEDDEGKKNFARDFMVEPLFIPETLTALEALVMFKKERADFAVALDEQGCAAGILTMSDVARVLFNRAIDENLSPALPHESLVKLVSANEYVVPGDMKIEEVNDVLHLRLSSEEFNTIGGWLLEQFGFLPSAGETLARENVVYIVEDQARRRILSVRIKLSAARA